MCPLLSPTNNHSNNYALEAALPITPLSYSLLYRITSPTNVCSGTTSFANGVYSSHPPPYPTPCSSCTNRLW